MRNLSDRLKRQELFFDLDDAAKEFIVDKGYDDKFGARPLKRAIQKDIEDPLAQEIINSKLKEGDSINIKLNKKSNELIISIAKKKKIIKKKNNTQKEEC